MVNETLNVPTLSLDDIEPSADKIMTQNSAKKVWVPNRNGIMVNIAAGFAESMKCDYVIVGFNKEEAMTFPDNSVTYIEFLNNCFKFSTLTKVKILAPVAQLTKKEIILKAIELNSPLHLSWTCYKGDHFPCGTCESCIRRMHAFKEQNMEDPFITKNIEEII